MGHCVPNVFIFVTEKEHNFIKDRKYCITSPSEREREKKGNLAELTQVSCGLFSLLSKYFQAKIKWIGATLTVFSFAAVVWSRHTTPSIPRRRESA